MLLPKEKHKNHEQQHAHSLNVNEPVSRADCRQGSLLVTSTREQKNHEERHTHGSSKYIYSSSSGSVVVKVIQVVAVVVVAVTPIAVVVVVVPIVVIPIAVV